MIEKDIENILSEFAQVEYVISDSNALFAKFEIQHLNQDMMNYIQSKLAPLGLKAVISSLTSKSENGVNADIVILKIFSANNGYHEPTASTYAFPKTKSRWAWLSHPSVNAILFAFTFIVVFITGAATIINREITDEWSWITGFQFSFSLLGILSAHEFGHYFAAKYHKLNVTLPYFLPGILIPPWISPGFGGTTLMPGTFGAFIRIKSPIMNKKQLMDVGVAGPIAGFVVCLMILVYGFAAAPERSYAYQFYDPQSIYNGEPFWHFGNSLLFNFLGQTLAGDRMPEMYDIIHYPFIFAGWFGLLVTALNLLPIGQLDGGHITYSLLGKKQKYVGYAAFLGILVMGLFNNNNNWLVWAILILVLIKIKHPPVAHDHEPLDRNRQIIGIIALIIFVLCFIPDPIYLRAYTK
jgi:membrane-associated protease RseP (regulator of RpoE activity)